ncbi:hypothetical protein GCM10027447_20920 [Glycomyces halotolerans]
MNSPDPRRRATRFAAAAAAGLLAAGTAALPATAQSADYPFLHGNVTIEEVAPGGTVEVSPSFVQEGPLPDDTVALVVSFSDSFSRIGLDLAGAEAQAAYDNCVEASSPISGGVVCAVTDYTDSPGTAFTISDASPVTYDIDETTVGPIDVCSCIYYVKSVNAETYESIFGDLSWNDESGNLLTLDDSGDAASTVGGDRDSGTITISNTEHPFDLSIDDVDVEGSEGDEVTVTVPVTNEGPAIADDRTDTHGSYEVRAQLPAGLELVRIDSDPHEQWQSEGWNCLHPKSLAVEYEYEQDKTELERFDLACMFRELAVGESVELTFTVRITDDAAADDGLLEVRERIDSPHTDSLDGDLENNLAVIGVNAADLIGGDDGEGSGKLKETGSSMTIVIGAAAAALAAGAVMFVVVRRRKAAADW